MGYTAATNEMRATLFLQSPTSIGLLSANPDDTIESPGRKGRTLKLDGNLINVEDFEALARACISVQDLIAVEVVEIEGGGLRDIPPVARLEGPAGALLH